MNTFREGILRTEFSRKAVFSFRIHLYIFFRIFSLAAVEDIIRLPLHRDGINKTTGSAEDARSVLRRTLVARMTALVLDSSNRFA